MATLQFDLSTQADGTALIKNALEGITIQDAQSFKTAIKETATGLELTIYDDVNAPTVYQIEGGKLKNILEIKASVNGVFNQAITDELAAANLQPRKGDVINSGGSGYTVITAEADFVSGEYKVNYNDIGRLTMEGQITVDVEDAALTAELVKLGRLNWTKSERISYLDGTSKTVEIEWAKMDTDNKKYIVKCGSLS